MTNTSSFVARPDQTWRIVLSGRGNTTFLRFSRKYCGVLLKSKSCILTVLFSQAATEFRYPKQADRGLVRPDSVLLQVPQELCS